VLQLALWFFAEWMRRREMVMSAAVRVVVCYIQGERDLYGYVSCS